MNNNKMELVTPVVAIQGAMVFALLAGFAFGMFTGQAHVAGLSMAWLALCGWFYTIAPVIGVWLAVGVIGCVAYSLAATSRKRSAR
ncbi:MAG TPA: hypothetical protein VFM10_04955 [Terriglobales bacterium]|nr:hypothetical protein [Terriglobales bacterium]